MNFLTLLRYVPHLLIAVAIVYANITYINMNNKIKEQEKIIKEKEIYINIQKENIEAIKLELKNKMNIKIFEATKDEKIKEIKKGIKYDTDKSIEIDSTRIHL